MTQDSFESDRDRELSRLFEAERRADESAAPDLAALLARRPRRRTSTGRRIALLATAALVALVTVAVLLVRGEPHRITPAAEPPLQLADWKSPTAFLLDTPGSELLTQIPTLAAPPTAGNAGVPQPTKGVAR